MSGSESLDHTGDVMTSAKRILLIYPALGMAGSLVRHIPLSLLYAAVDSLKQGFEVDILDARIAPDHWERDLRAMVTTETLMVGISVMTGAPIHNALNISRLVKRLYPDMTVVWGGPHCTFNGEDVLAESSVDYVVAGYGSKPLAQLASRLASRPGSQDFAAISGLIFRESGHVRVVPPEPAFEIMDYHDIPYHLVEQNLGEYGQLDNGERIFPLYSAMGCPYKCAFCSSPAQYREIRRKYVPLEVVEVVDHIEFVHQRYGATYIYFIDEDSFVRLDHVEAIIDEMNRRGLKLKMGFRGARINEVIRMSDTFLSKLAQAGTNIMHIGAESGSPRMLKLMRKNCTVDEILAVNRKMARHPEIKIAYNWIVGLPGETLEDLRLTRELILRMIHENPGAVMFMPNKYRPLPGTELYDVSLSMGYRKPESLQDWVETEAEGDYRPPWYGDAFADMINMMQVTSFFIDDKLFKVETGDTIRFQVLRLLARLYKPLALLRYRRGNCAALLEYKLFYLFTSSFRT